jgi:hypothetical protein
LLQCSRRPFSLHLHSAIVPIAHITVEPEPSRLAFREEAEADALHVAEDLRLEPAAIRCRVTRQSGVREWGGRHHDRNALGRVGDRLQCAAYDRQIGLDELPRGLFRWRSNHELAVVAVTAACGPFPQVERRVGQVQA